MTTIAYDLPMRDFIAGLDRTRHVTHTQHRKTRVTLHHNGGRLSHEGVLSVWQVRPASAHFNIDAAGTAAQYVRVNEYAWATGSTPGNQQSISIEMCNQTLGPDWVVSETTWRSAARLAGWLFARVIGTRPTHDTLVRHKYWSATTCAGPYIDRVYDQVLLAAQQSFDRIVHGIEEDMFSDEDRRNLQIVTQQVTGGVSSDGRTLHKWPQLNDDDMASEDEPLTMLDFSRENHNRLRNLQFNVDYDKLAEALQKRGLLLPHVPSAEEIANEIYKRMQS